MARRKRRKKPVLFRLMKKADHALSQHVREETAKEYWGKCPLCGRGPLIEHKPTKKDPRLLVPAIQCCFHFIRRRRKILRWRKENVVGACNRCNYIEYRDPDLSRAWFIKMRGVDLYLRLVDESKESFEPTEEYLRGIIQKYGSAGDV